MGGGGRVWDGGGGDGDGGGPHVRRWGWGHRRGVWGGGGLELVVCI